VQIPGPAATVESGGAAAVAAVHGVPPIRGVGEVSDFASPLKLTILARDLMEIEDH
jgi:hypothetical protein